MLLLGKDGSEQHWWLIPLLGPLEKAAHPGQVPEETQRI